MKIGIGISVLMILFSFAPAKQASSFQQLQQLVGGTWVMQSKVSVTCEEWKRKNSNGFTGISYRVKGKDTMQLETVELTLKGEEVNYIATTANQNDSKPVAFKLVEVKGTRFTFSNPQHDFPQRVIYEFVNSDSLHAWIEGTYISEGTTVPKEIRRDFYYARSKKNRT